MADAAKVHGFRIIAPDRPGIGGSPLQTGRRISAWPALVAEMADAMGLDRFSIMGVSGGGPYTLACAAALPSRVRAAAVVCGAPQISEMQSHDTLNFTYRTLLWIFHRKPWLVRALFGMTRPFMMWRYANAFLPPLRALLPRPDAETLGDSTAFESVFGCNRDAFADVDGLFHDASLYTHPWEFRLSDIKAPIHIWHGTEDSNFHWSVARELASRLPTATLHLVENEGHFSLPIRHAGEIMAALRASVGLGKGN